MNTSLLIPSTTTPRCRRYRYNVALEISSLSQISCTDSSFFVQGGRRVGSPFGFGRQSLRSVPYPTLCPSGGQSDHRSFPDLFSLKLRERSKNIERQPTVRRASIHRVVQAGQTHLFLQYFFHQPHQALQRSTKPV